MIAEDLKTQTDRSHQDGSYKCREKEGAAKNRHYRMSMI